MSKVQPLCTSQGERIVFTHGLRTPFVRQATAFSGMSALDLGRMLVNELIVRSELPPEIVDVLIFGQVIQMPAAPNIAREIVLSTGLPVSTDAFSVSRVCATSFQSVASLAGQLMAGVSRAGIAGGADSASVLPITLSAGMARALLEFSKARTWRQKWRALRQLSAGDILLQKPSVAEYSTGLRMGDSAEQMAKHWGISREAQDDFAWQSHQKAAAAWQQGRLADQVITGWGETFTAITQDNTLRDATPRADYAALKPAFDRRHGSVTAANSTVLTDGAAAVIMMTESRMRELGLSPLGYLRSYAFSAGNVGQDMLSGPARATPLALDRAGVTLRDLSLFDMHEAFAAQVLTNLKMFTDQQFARQMQRDQPIGEVDPDIFNVQGGSLAYGHPFAATGARMITQTLYELARRGGGLGVVTACAAGGLGAAMVLEVE